MSITSKHEVGQTEHGVVPAKRKKGGCAGHCKRFWWLHLIIFLVIALVLILVTIFAIVPKIGQDKVNDAKLEIQGVNMLQSTSNSFLMEINSTIKTDGSVHADIDGFEGEMYLADLEPHTTFATLQFPATNGDKHQQVNVSQEVQIKDMDAFTTFNTWFVSNDTLRITISGKTKFSPAGLSRKYDVDFKKTVTVNGLKRFAGTQVTSGKIDIDPDVEFNFNGTATIPNQSVFTLDIGNVSFVNFVEDAKVGALYIDNLLLVPGDNKVKIRGNIEQVEVLELVRSPEYCKTGVIPFKLLGDSVTNDGQDLTYFADALGSGNQTVNIDIGKIITESLGFGAGCED